MNLAGSWTEMKHWDQAPGVMDWGAGLEMSTQGCAPWSTALHSPRIAVHHLQRGALHAVHHVTHLYTCTRENVEFLIFIFRILSTPWGVGLSSILPREGPPLHDQILSQKTWKNERKLGENVFFWAFSWKMVKYFIEILSYFGKKMMEK